MNHKFIYVLICFLLLACESKEKSQTDAQQNINGEFLYITVEAEHSGAYKRKEWLPKWGDQNGDGINTRHQVLMDQSSETVELNIKGDKVFRGTWTCPYTGITFHDPRKVDIDHFIPLKEVSESGGWQWDTEKQNDFANGADSLELLVVESKANRDKSDKDPVDWLPPNKNYHCAYMERWALIKARNQLSMDAPEFKLLQQQLQLCKKQKKAHFILKQKL